MNLILMHPLWVSGSLINFFYIDAIKAFIQDKSNHLKWMKILTLISAIGAVLCLVYWAATGNPVLLDSEKPYIDFNNIMMKHVGGFNPSAIIKFLGTLVLISTVYSAVYFIRFILKTKKSDVILLTGISMTLVATINDMAISLVDATYLFPIMFAANVFEILRITNYNQKKLATELNETTKDLIETAKLSELGSNYALLAHEILNPLGAAMGYFHSLTKKLNQEQITPEIRTCIEKINKQHDRIEHLAKNVKKYARVSPQTEASAKDLKEIIKDALETVQIRAKGTGVSITYAPEMKNIQILCLEDQIIQVVTNILNNSIDAVNHLEERWIKISHSLDEKNKRVILSIKDAGHGIPSEIKERMWEHRFTTKKSDGVGLGLSLCRSIVKNHSCSIYLNEDCLNTEFIIELPAI